MYITATPELQVWWKAEYWINLSKICFFEVFHTGHMHEFASGGLWNWGGHWVVRMSDYMCLHVAVYAIKQSCEPWGEVVNPVPRFRMFGQGLNTIFCIEYVCNYFRERCIGRFDHADSIHALWIEFRALLRHLPSGAPSRTTNVVLQNAASQVCSSKYPSGIYPR